MYKLSTIELLDGLISDIRDDINDLEDDLRRGCGRVEQYEKRIRIDTMRRWLQHLKIIRDEQSMGE